jgi:hypothetical protein
VVRRLALERDGSSPEGYRGWLLGGPLRLFGPWALLRPGPRLRRMRFTVLWFCTHFIIFRKRGFSLAIRGPLWLSLTINT